MLYLVFAVLGLHIISFPLVISVKLIINSDENSGKIKIKLFFIPLFVKRIDVEQIKNKIEKAIDKTERESDKVFAEVEDNAKPKNESAFKRFLIDAVKRVAMRIRVRDIELYSRLGIGDAAVSAVTVGSLRVVYSQTCKVLGYDGGIAEIEPDYNSECIFVDFWGIFSLCFADIIYAVCAAVIKTITSGTRKRRNYANTVAK